MVPEASQPPLPEREPEHGAPPLRVWFATPEAGATLDVATLDEPEREAWNRLHSEHRRRDWLASRVLLRASMKQPHATRSQSHSRGCAALVIGPGGGRPGIDLEFMAPRAFLELGAIAFAPAEVACLRSLTDPSARCAAFYELWTLKEACTKALGLHLVDGLRQCRFVTPDARWAPQLPTREPWAAHVYAPRPDLRLALVWIGSASMPPVAAREWPDSAAQWPVMHRLTGSESSSENAC